MLNEIFAVIEFIVKAFIHIWPYLLLTIPISVVIHLSGTSRFITRAFSAKPLIAILLATIVGAFSPFCSCGVIPIISSLLIGGVPIAPVMSFWLASPSMDPEIFFLSVAKLGMPLAVARLSATFFLSLGAGYLTHILLRAGWLPEIVLSETGYTKRTSLKNRLISAIKPLIQQLVQKPALATIPVNSGLVDTYTQNNNSSAGNCGTCKTSSSTLNSSCTEKPVEGLFQKGLIDAGKTIVTQRSKYFASRLDHFRDMLADHNTRRPYLRRSLSQLLSRELNQGFALPEIGIVIHNT